jgi:prevent-host-death family protein
VTTTVNIHDAKTNLSRLIEQVEGGEEVVIARAGRPVARLVPLREPSGPRTPGAWRGRVVIADDFDDLPAEVATAFAGEEER